MIYKQIFIWTTLSPLLVLQAFKNRYITTWARADEPPGPTTELFLVVVLSFSDLCSFFPNWNCLCQYLSHSFLNG